MTTARCEGGCDVAEEVGVGALTECSHSRVRGIERCDRTLGSRRSPIEVLMYGDLRSPQSARTYRSIRAAISGSRGIILAHRHVLDPNDASPRRAAGAAEAAAAQGAFWPMCDLLYRTGADPSSIIDHCRSLGLDEQRLRNSIIDLHGAARIDHDLELAIASDVRSVPTLFVNGVRWPTDDPHRDLRSDLEDVARRAQPLWAEQGPSPRRVDPAGPERLPADLLADATSAAAAL